jgi:hypothetical protein
MPDFLMVLYRSGSKALTQCGQDKPLQYWPTPSKQESSLHEHPKFYAGLTGTSGRVYAPYKATWTELPSTINTVHHMTILVETGNASIQKKQVATNSIPHWIDTRTVPDSAPDFLTSACFAGGTKVLVCFSDRLSRVIDLTELGIDTSWLRLDTVRHSSEGSALEVTDKDGETIHIDSAVLRSHCDPKYAAELQQAIADISANYPIRRISDEKQHRLDYLMDKNNEGQLTPEEQEEFLALGRELEQLTIDNARRLAEQG